MSEALAQQALVERRDDSGIVIGFGPANDPTALDVSRPSFHIGNDYLTLLGHIDATHPEHFEVCASIVHYLEMEIEELDPSDKRAASNIKRHLTRMVGTFRHRRMSLDDIAKLLGHSFVMIEEVSWRRRAGR